MTDLLKDLSTLTGVHYTNLSKLNIHAINDVSHIVLESILDNKEVSEIDIGIGILKILHTDEEIKYKFIPNDMLTHKITYVIKHKESPLCKKVSETLGERINNAYKDLF